MAQLTTRDGVRLFYERHGSGDAVVLLLMGLGMQGRVWGETAVRLEARGYVVVTMDNRGVGRSDTPWTPWTVGTMADDAVEVLDAVGAERAYVVGASLGGMIAQAVALRHPARVAGLALVSTTGGFPRMNYVPPAAVLGLLSLLVTRSRGGSPEARVRSTLKLITSERFADELT